MSESPTSSPPSPSKNNSSPPPSSSPSPPSGNKSPPPSSSDNPSPPPPNNKSPPPSSPPPSPNKSPPPSNKSPPPSGNSSPSPPPPQQGQSSPSPPPPNGSTNPRSPPSTGGGGNGRNYDPPSIPPPKSSGHRSSPPRPIGPNGGSSSKGSSSSNELPIIIGLAVGAGLVVIIFALLCVLCCKKKKKPGYDRPYYNPKGVGDNNYYNPNGQQQQYDPHGNLPPPPGGMGPPNWGKQPSSLSPQMMGPNSSDMSSNFSGPHGPSLPPPHPAVALGFNQSTFTYDELAAATQGFSQSQLLGQGGFGYVHKGVLPNGKEIAVKSLKSGSGQGEREFQAEVEIISRVHHRHLVSLVGYCIAGGQRMLVYEFLPNSTLEYHLHGKGLPVMEWSTRLKIALGMARGLAYLHEDCHPRIIHRDIKTANILLDFNYDAKVADFGLAKLSQGNETHVSTRVMGTFGYLAPEYASSGKLTEKSDVFSFGVMMLELITGRRPVDPTGEMEDSLVDWARPLCIKSVEDGNFDELVDPRLEKNYAPYEMARMVASAAASIRHSARRRPKMSQIVRALEGDVSLDDLTDGVKPGQSSQFDVNSGDSTYSADMRRFRKLALDSREYPSSEFGTTSEYGQNPSTSSSEEMTRR